MKLFSRKSDVSKATVGFLLVIAVSTALLCTDKLTGAEWCGLLQWCVPAFLGSEAARRFSSTAPKE